ncbi:MAG: hypothetical protein ACRCYT_02005 [Cetobacterium sp.]
MHILNHALPFFHEREVTEEEKKSVNYKILAEKMEKLEEILQKTPILFSGYYGAYESPPENCCKIYVGRCYYEKEDKVVYGFYIDIWTDINTG